MKTIVKKQNNTWIVSLSGKLSFENQSSIRADLNRIQSQSKQDSVSRIIFDFKGLQFVGSSGITQFIETLKEFNQKSASRSLFCHVGSDFKKIIQAFDQESELTFSDSTDTALEQPTDAESTSPPTRNEPTA